jgi:hypothetical protein
MAAQQNVLIPGEQLRNSPSRCGLAGNTGAQRRLRRPSALVTKDEIRISDSRDPGSYTQWLREDLSGAIEPSLGSVIKLQN